VIGRLIASFMWMLEMIGEGHVLPADESANQVRAWQA